LLFLLQLRQLQSLSYMLLSACDAGLTRPGLAYSKQKRSSKHSTYRSISSPFVSLTFAFAPQTTREPHAQPKEAEGVVGHKDLRKGLRRRQLFQKK
jgi:Tfp pilus assembly protein PilP